MSDENPSRRSILRGIGAAGVSAVGASGVVAADESGDVSELGERYDDPESTERQVEEHAGEVLEALAERGIIAEASVDVFDLENELQTGDAAAEEAVDGRLVTAYTDPASGAATADIRLSKTTPAHVLTVHVRPEAGDSYALVVERDSGTEFAIDPSTEDVRVPLDESESGSDGLLAAGLDALNLGGSAGLAGGSAIGGAATAAAPTSCDDVWTCTSDICKRTRTNAGGYRLVYTHLHHKCSPSYDRCHCYVDKQQCDGVCDCVGFYCD